MDVNEVTIESGWIVGLAIVALIAAGWRKPARATPRSLRAHPSLRPTLQPSNGFGVTAVEAPAYRHPRWWRRLWSVVAGSVLAVWTGAITATIIGFGAAWMVIRLSEMLKR